MAVRSALLALVCCCVLALSCAQKVPDRASPLAAYLKEEQRMRQKVPDPAALEDSIDALRQRYGIDPESLIKRLDHTPADWLDLLRELKRGT